MFSSSLHRISTTNGMLSPTCGITNLRLHLVVILRKVLHAMSCTPSNVSCMNSKSFFTTVLRNFQWYRRNRGYCPTTYMMFDAMTALLALPLVISQRLRRSRITVTRKRFSCSSPMLPLMDPIAQHSVLSLCQPALHSRPLSCSASFSTIWRSVSSWSRCERSVRVSFITLYSVSTALSFMVSFTMLPFSSSTTMTSSGLAMRQIISRRSCDKGSAYSSLRAPIAPPFAAASPNEKGLAVGVSWQSELKMSATKRFQ
mmetsp:Transcript_31953/g.89467  ORF Transcript_31953/g.89467 Transcript_31953/m.89467 type:complete len:257 (-) Transcript_31953:1101-1871(-)